MASHAHQRSFHRSLLLWISCAVVSVLLLATPEKIRQPIAGALEWTVFLPVRAVIGWEGRSLLTHLENRQLQRELTAHRLEVSRLLDVARENDALREMLGMEKRATMELTPAQVVGRSLDWSGEVLWTELSGTAKQGCAVVTPSGLVGRTSRVAGSRAWIETLWHMRVAVSVVDGRSGEQGILRWDATRSGEFLIDPVPMQGDFRIGDPILTSGLGEVFPRGILVGHVLGEEENPRTQLKRIRVRPAVRRGQARELFLLIERPPERDGSSLRRSDAGPNPSIPSLPGSARTIF